ncbi:MAG TPA: flagellar motor switch phosphatase FliY [Halanaerobiales bacterium]|nr:flagellar motor switch phosphatase FliY [Halanaerobiales bacterium]
MSNGNGQLSQEEIDSLINAGDDEVGEGNQLTEDEADIIGEIGNIAMGSAATALFTLLNKKVDITAPKVDISTFKEVVAEYSEPFVLVKVEYIEGLEGLNLLILDSKDAAIIADLMMGGSGENVDENTELDEIHLSAVGEAMNQMMGSSSTSISNIIDKVVNISPPEPIFDVDADEFENDYFDKDDSLVVTSFDLKIGNLIDSTFKQLAPLKFTKKLIKNLKSNNEGLTAKSDNSMQSNISEVAAENTQKQKEEKKQPAKAAANAGSHSSSQQLKSSEKVDVQEAQFPQFGEKEGVSLPQNMELLKDVPLTVTVRLGKTRMTISEVLDLGEGSIIELDKLAGELVDLYVNGKLIAKGEVVVIDESFGFRVKDIISPAERISDL